MQRTVLDVFPDHESLALAAAAYVVGRARRSLKVGGSFAVALAGGSTPRRTYEFLAASPLSDLMPWTDTHVFWSDERCVPLSDPRSNERMARRSLLDYVPVPPGQIHPMRCGAAEYEGGLRESFPLDLVLLGLGSDGHTASLFPGSPALFEEERWTAGVFGSDVAGAEGRARANSEARAEAGAGAAAATAETAAAAIAGAPDDGAAEGLWRVTLTASFINTASAVAFLVSGAAKAEAVKQVIEGPLDIDRLPAQLIRPEDGELRWFLDDEAAALLTSATRDRPGS